MLDDSFELSIDWFSGDLDGFDVNTSGEIEGFLDVNTSGDFDGSLEVDDFDLDVFLDLDTSGDFDGDLDPNTSGDFDKSLDVDDFDLSRDDLEKSAASGDFDVFLETSGDLDRSLDLEISGDFEIVDWPSVSEISVVSKDIRGILSGVETGDVAETLSRLVVGYLNRRMKDHIKNNKLNIIFLRVVFLLTARFNHWHYV